MIYRHNYRIVIPISLRMESLQIKLDIDGNLCNFTSFLNINLLCLFDFWATLSGA